MSWGHVDCDRFMERVRVRNPYGENSSLSLRHISDVESASCHSGVDGGINTIVAEMKLSLIHI